MDIGISREQTKVGKVMYGKEGWREQEKEVDKGDGPGGGLLTRSLHPCLLVSQLIHLLFGQALLVLSLS